MHKRVRRKKLKKIVYGGLFIFLTSLFVFYFFVRDTHDFSASDHIDILTIIDDGQEITFYNVTEKTVGELLVSYDGEINENDRVFPGRDEKIFEDDCIVIEREKELTVHVDDEKKVLKTYRDEIGTVVALAEIEMDDDDIIMPSSELIINSDMEVTITRVDYEEEVVTKKITYETIEKKDDNVNFLERYVEQNGENGVKEITYRIAYHDGEEVDRKILSEEITREPVDEIIVQGTKVKLGKKHTGACSWYAYTGTLSAANPWLPKGSYVKVTNKANEKSVIVQINDRGPFVEGRIIDLDKVAFEKIASLGAGVIDVEMEEVVN